MAGSCADFDNFVYISRVLNKKDLGEGRSDVSVSGISSCARDAKKGNPFLTLSYTRTNKIQVATQRDS